MALCELQQRRAENEDAWAAYVADTQANLAAEERRFIDLAEQVAHDEALEAPAGFAPA